MPTSNSSVPGDDDWAGYEGDLDAEYAHGLFSGKSIAEVQHLFGDNLSIERSSELLFVPRRVFQYYVLAFAEFVRSEAARGDANSANAFLNLLLTREKIDRGSVAEVYPKLAATVDFVAGNQIHFDADQEIYGNFDERAEQIRAACR